MTLAFYERTGGDLRQLVSRLGQITDLAPTGVYLTTDGSLHVSADEQTIVAVAHSKGVRVCPVAQNYLELGPQVRRQRAPVMGDECGPRSCDAGDDHGHTHGGDR